MQTETVLGGGRLRPLLIRQEVGPSLVRRSHTEAVLYIYCIMDIGQDGRSRADEET